MHTGVLIPYWHPLYVGKTILADNIALQRHRKIGVMGTALSRGEVLNAFGELVDRG
jgi:hypothetical protein